MKTLYMHCPKCERDRFTCHTFAMIMKESQPYLRCVNCENTYPVELKPEEVTHDEETNN